MSSDYDATEFLDGDYEAQKSPRSGGPGVPAPAGRAPSREEVDSKVAEAQQKLADLKRAQEELERERAALQETRRRQAELQTGRDEMVHNLTRGLGLLEEAEFGARREAEQMAKSIGELREALVKIQAINEATWTRDNFSVELTRGLTALENARMEWNTARLKFQVLSRSPEGPAGSAAAVSSPQASPFWSCSFGEMCRVGFALTWPVAGALLVALGVIAALLLRK